TEWIACHFTSACGPSRHLAELQNLVCYRGIADFGKPCVGRFMVHGLSQRAHLQRGSQPASMPSCDGPHHPRQHRKMLVAARERRKLDEVGAHPLDHVGAQRARKGLRAVEHQPVALRSEEHTSELQSRENLVCRLLLEKKKKTMI